jgi:lipopolysaccharide cholinephosphotransferase
MKLSKEELRRLQLTELELLCEVDRICRKNGIRYTLCAGTLLGAIRHKGFIPWDDDADVAFLPEDYEKFFKACKRDLNKEKFFLQDYRTDPYYRWGYAKLRRNNSAYIRENQEHMKYHSGICIDLFTLNYVPDNHILRVLYHGVFFVIRKILYSEAGRVSEKNELIRNIYKLLSKIPRDFVFKIANLLVYNKPSELVNGLYYPSAKTCRYGIPLRCLQNSVTVEFENHEFMAMEGYEEVLSMAYGDYMTPPDEKNRESHNPASRIEFPID